VDRGDGLHCKVIVRMVDPLALSGDISNSSSCSAPTTVHGCFLPAKPEVVPWKCHARSDHGICSTRTPRLLSEMAECLTVTGRCFTSPPGGQHSLLQQSNHARTLYIFYNNRLYPPSTSYPFFFSFSFLLFLFLSSWGWEGFSPLSPLLLTGTRGLPVAIQFAGI